MAEQVPYHEYYSNRANAAFVATMAERTASREAAFLLPHLRAEMHVLDAGCGPGSITLGLAAAVAPGKVVGIDVQPSQVEQARALADQRGVTNVRFEATNVYELPFPDGSFDAAFANAVLMQLREPVRALAELRRVLRPGGIAGVRDLDDGGDLFVPATPLLQQWFSLKDRVQQHNGANTYIGRHHRRLLLEAGFVRTEAGASILSEGSLEKSRHHAAFFKAQLSGLAPSALAEGWIDQATVDAIAAEFDAWAESPDAFHAATWCEALGWVSD